MKSKPHMARMKVSHQNAGGSGSNSDKDVMIPSRAPVLNLTSILSIEFA
jgi:hypothetical protein